MGAWGLAATLVVVAAGLARERASLGPSDQTALAHVAADVTDRWDALERSLDRAARQVVAHQADPVADAGDVARRRALFDLTARLLTASRPAVDAVSVYDAAGRPVAWAGRPSSLPAERLSGPSAVFTAPGPLGVRLVRVEPLVAREAGRRDGVVVAEAILTRDGAPGEPRGTRLADASPVRLHLQPAYEGVHERTAENAFPLTAPGGRVLLTASVSASDLAALRATYRQRTVAAAWLTLALGLAVIAAVVRHHQERQRRAVRAASLTLAALGAILAARASAGLAVPASWRWGQAPPPLDGAWLWSPADWLASALAALACVVLLLDLLERWRRQRRHAVREATLGYWSAQALAGVVAGAMVGAHLGALAALVRVAGADGVRFNLLPVEPRRLALVAGLVAANAAVLWLAVGMLRLVSIWWRTRGGDRLRRVAAGAVFVLAALGTAAVTGAPLSPARLVGLLPPLALVLAAAAAVRWVMPRYRHASQAARLTVGYLALVLPTLSFYPLLVASEQTATEHTIAAVHAPEVLNHRDELRVRLARSREQLDAVPGLAEQFLDGPAPPGGPVDASRAYFLWSQTELGRQRLTSSVELYTPSGDLVSRFALNLPAEFLATERPVDTDCAWDVFGEAVASTDDQVLLHAGRAVCLDDGRRVGTILVHVVLDYATLPFVADQDPSAALARGAQAARPAGGQPVAFAVYGWGRTPVYPTAGTAWPISTDLLRRLYHGGREPFWEVLSRGDRRFRVLLNNDRAGIYAIGYPLPRPIDHAVALAEAATLTGLTFVALLVGAGVVNRLAGRRPATGRDLLREVRRSFYRKLFLLFVAASVVPVLALALVTRNYLAGQLREGLEGGAVRTASAARRVIETVVSQQRRDRSDPVAAVSDEIMVSVSRIIDQDVNVFIRDVLVATSQRDLFASGLLPTRIPADVARAISLERQSSYVGDERLGGLQYTVAAVPVRDGESGAVLTVPLTLRQQEIEGEVAALDRRVTLAAVLFILLGAAIGYVTAERLGDPIQRLTRATGRIARGDLGARIVSAPADELGRLVDAFNQMAEDLQRQRAELERSNRLAAWADMARQVAHDIKNPLTPIQLQAEFLGRVHKDSGAPLGPVVDSCVQTILSQVSLLRSIASEFSTFASSPVARPARTRIEEVVDEVLAPYRTGLPANVRLVTAHAPGVPDLWVDRGLVARALVNVIENALHAMRGGGTLTVRTGPHPAGALVEIQDTGVGMEKDAMDRLFEPYFSTKATGTGLGLTIAKRNVELNAGGIAVSSAKGQGTTVAITLPASAPDAGEGAR